MRPLHTTLISIGQVDERAPSPEAVLLKSSSLELVGPSEDDDAEFAKELAKLVTDSADSKRVDKKTALALWETTVPPPVIRKKRMNDTNDQIEASGADSSEETGVMKFTLFTKRGNKPQVRGGTFWTFGLPYQHI